MTRDELLGTLLIAQEDITKAAEAIQMAWAQAAAEGNLGDTDISPMTVDTYLAYPLMDLAQSAGFNLSIQKLIDAVK